MQEEVRDVVDRLRESSKFALMSAARETVIEAAGLIEKLRRRIMLADAAIRSDSVFRLTEAEREALEAILIDPESAPANSVSTLRGLLERTQ